MAEPRKVFFSVEGSSRKLLFFSIVSLDTNPAQILPIFLREMLSFFK